MKPAKVLPALCLLLFVPAAAYGQTNSLTLFEDVGTYTRGQAFFVFGDVGGIVPGAFVVTQVENPDGRLCQVQQVSPLPDGVFFTEKTILSGAACGAPGTYTIKAFYGTSRDTVTFAVSPETHVEPSEDEYIESGRALVSELLESLDEQLASQYGTRLSSASSLDDLALLYSDMRAASYTPEFIYDVPADVRPVIDSMLAAVADLATGQRITPEDTAQLDSEIYTALFYYMIGDREAFIDSSNRVFGALAEANPPLPTVRTRNFEALDKTAFNLMIKSGSILGEETRDELGFIFARGTAPVYADELEGLVDILKKVRYLDIISRKDSSLYNLINVQFDSLKSSLEGKDSIAEIIEQKPRVDALYDAAILLRDLADVSEFVSDEGREDSDLARLIAEEWEDLEAQLASATSPADILAARDDIHDMKNVIEISSRLSRVIELSRENNVDSETTRQWPDMLARVDDAESVGEILSIVSSFEKSLTELREKRNPLTVLKFEFEKLKVQAERQDDQVNLHTINNILRSIEAAGSLAGSSSAVKNDRSEVLLAWASIKLPEIQKQLQSYDVETYKVRASHVLEKAQSIENIAELSMTRSRFLPGYPEFIESVHAELAVIRQLVLDKDINGADTRVRELFRDYQVVHAAYEADPRGSSVGYSITELKRIDYRERLEGYENVAHQVLNWPERDYGPPAAEPELAEYENEYRSMVRQIRDQIDHGNFLGAEKGIVELGDYLSEKLALLNSEIRFVIKFDSANKRWIIDGHVNKEIFDRRENIYVTVFDADGSVLRSLKFTDSKEGRLFTQWDAPTDAGLYIVKLVYKNQEATQVVYIPEIFDDTYGPEELDVFALATKFEDIQSLIREFGGTKYEENRGRIDPAIDAVRTALDGKNHVTINSKINALEDLIVRYLPNRAPTAAIDVAVDGQSAYLSGAVKKEIEFSEKLYVDIFDRRGVLLETVAIRDTATGHFNKPLTTSFSPGIYVAQLEYHDLVINDFFRLE